MSGNLFKLTIVSLSLFAALLLPVRVSAEEVLLTDDFSTNENDWFVNENVKIQNGRYEFTANYSWINDTMEDGSVEADSFWLGGDESQGYGLVFRVSDAQNFYFLWITGKGSYTVCKVVDDRALFIKDWTNSASIEKRGENHLRVELCGPWMNIIINEEKVTVLKDDTFSQGGYGFYTRPGAHVAFDNIRVVSNSPFQLHMPRTGNMESFRDMTGRSFSLTLTGNSNGRIWGSDIYTWDSDLATAAVHAGALNAGQTGTILITVLAGRDSYSASTRSGITSKEYGSWDASYRIERLE